MRILAPIRLGIYNLLINKRPSRDSRRMEAASVRLGTRVLLFLFAFAFTLPIAQTSNSNPDPMPSKHNPPSSRELNNKRTQIPIVSFSFSCSTLRSWCFDGLEGVAAGGERAFAGERPLAGSRPKLHTVNDDDDCCCKRNEPEWPSQSLFLPARSLAIQDAATRDRAAPLIPQLARAPRGIITIITIAIIRARESRIRDPRY